jgi:hypothetical protein
VQGIFDPRFAHAKLVLPEATPRTCRAAPQECRFEDRETDEVVCSCSTDSPTATGGNSNDDSLLKLAFSVEKNSRAASPQRIKTYQTLTAEQSQ